jgi:lipoprotein-anchoring transpeptidase ErfK/SrfK
VTDSPDTQGKTRSRPRAWIIAGLLVLVPVIPIVIALAVSSKSVKPDATALASYKPLGAAPVVLPKPSPKPLAPGRGTLVALIRHPTDMRSAPGGHVIASVGRKTSFGSPQALWVVRHSGKSVGVISPQAGNGHVGWIKTSAAVFVRVNWAIHVSLRNRQVTVLENGHVREKYTVAIGRPSAPTPTGRFAVTDRLNTGDPSGPYGCCILALSAEAPHAIQGWGGGNRIAIHSTPETSSIGLPVSHGCLRLTLAEGRWLLQHIPLGTPTIIRE